MSVSKSSIKENEYFVTSTDQLRKVTQIDQDDQGRDRVHYLSKSAKIAGRKFNFGHAIASPPLLETFLSDCSEQLTSQQVIDLRRTGILLTGE